MPESPIRIGERSTGKRGKIENDIFSPSSSSRQRDNLQYRLVVKIREDDNAAYRRSVRISGRVKKDQREDISTSTRPRLVGIGLSQFDKVNVPPS